MQVAVEELARRRLDVHEAESALDVLAEDLSECMNGNAYVAVEICLVSRNVIEEGDDPLLGLAPRSAGQLIERWDMHLDTSSDSGTSEDSARAAARGMRELLEELPMSQILREWEIGKSELHTLVQWRPLGDEEARKMQHHTRALEGVDVTAACVTRDMATTAMESDTVLVMEVMKSVQGVTVRASQEKECTLKEVNTTTKREHLQRSPKSAPPLVRPSPLRNSMSSTAYGQGCAVGTDYEESHQQPSSAPIGIPGARSAPHVQQQQLGTSFGALISPPATGLRARSTGSVARSFGDSPRPMRRSAGEKPMPQVSSPSELIGSFAGSFQESLLTGHMSGIPCNEFEGFTADISASNGDSRTPHKKIPFSAILYHANNGEPMPYVASIPLEKPFRIPPHGLLQVTLFNPSKTPIKMFLVRFNVSDMPVSSKTFIRQTISTVGVLAKVKYAVQVQLMCPKKKRYYLRKEIRVVFPLRKPDESLDKLVVEHKLPEAPRYFRLEDSPDRKSVV